MPGKLPDRTGGAAGATRCRGLSTGAIVPFAEPHGSCAFRRLSSDSVDRPGRAVSLPRGNKEERNMMDRLREWGFPIGLLLVWAIAAVFTVSALVGMDATVKGTQSAPHLTHVVAHAPATHGPKAAPPS